MTYDRDCEIWIAIDGRAFETQDSCERYEAALAAVPEVQEPSDTQMLDWMAQHGAHISYGNDAEYCNVWLPARRDGTEARPAEGYPQKCYDNPREAIRAAISAQGGK